MSLLPSKTSTLGQPDSPSSCFTLRLLGAGSIHSIRGKHMSVPAGALCPQRSFHVLLGSFSWLPQKPFQPSALVSGSCPAIFPGSSFSADGLASCFSRKIEVVEATIPFTSLSPTQLYRTLLVVGRMRRIMDNSSLPGTIDLPLCFLPSCHSVEVLLLCPAPPVSASPST